MSKSLHGVVRQRGSLLLLVAVMMTVTGCAGYQLGSMLPPDIQTVFVPTFNNETDEPLLEVEATRRTITSIQRDG